MSRVIAVFEANGPLGASICRSLSQTHEVRALMRDARTPSANALNRSGVQVVQINYNDPSTFDSALDDVYGAVVITLSDYVSSDGYEVEIAEGKVVAEACLRASVCHVIYSTQMSVLDIIGVKCRHMDAKARVESYMKELHLPLTRLVLPLFYEHLTMPPLKPVPVQQKGFYFEIPMGHTPLNLISLEDVGNVVVEVFNQGEKFVKKSLSISGDKMTVKDIAGTFSEVLQPKRFQDKQITSAQFRAFSVPGADDLANMFDFFCRVDQRTNLELTKQLNPSVRSLHQWLVDNQNAVIRAMDAQDAPCKALMAL
ncbi:hypothetical protein CAPTEDRAFT_161267 [Capitella teleta]|uniref:NmrA-like family domain-containing protein 1 n=1 Tax=Capitella teleta TaxID=283909 RepID=R7TRG8_CAPTE|nr:hypothetical protein CAPTEDRAFT_161267 [Capitella teleta]|eukprot:ELT96234.1 hypothetical protein CAPTEDRAFT_161267 [Capitella teleta]